jgi:hypothetical protein
MIVVDTLVVRPSGSIYEFGEFHAAITSTEWRTGNREMIQRPAPKQRGVKKTEAMTRERIAAERRFIKCIRNFKALSPPGC